MILDIMFNDGPVQIQNVHKFRVFCTPEPCFDPEVVIDFKDKKSPQKVVKLSTIKCITVTND